MRHSNVNGAISNVNTSNENADNKNCRHVIKININNILAILYGNDLCCKLFWKNVDWIF